jgi:hypothetical protein
MMKAFTICNSTEINIVKVIIYKYHWPANKTQMISANKHNIPVRLE